MNQDAESRERALEALARELVDEALAPYEAALPEAALGAVRASLEDDLLADPDGRLLLRRALPDPQLEQSGETGCTTDVDEKHTGS